MLALLVVLLPSFCGAWAVSEVRVSCGEDAVLRCEATSGPGVQYRDVRWYRMNNGSRTGILRHNLKTNTTSLYFGFSREAVEVLGNSLDLWLTNASSEDSGTYICLLSAPVGHQNQEGHILLQVTGCAGEESKNNLWLDITLTVLIVLSLVTFFICWKCMKSVTILGGSKKQQQQQQQLKVLKIPLQKKSLKLIYCPDPLVTGASQYQHMVV